LYFLHHYPRQSLGCRDFSLTCPEPRSTIRCEDQSSSSVMTLKMETDISEDVVILYCAGRLVFGDETAAFRERLRSILLGTRHIVVNLSRIDYVDSGGLGTLVATLASTRQRQGEIKLVRPNQRVTELLQRTHLNTVFKCYKSDEEAVTAFRTNS